MMDHSSVATLVAQMVVVKAAMMVVTMVRMMVDWSVDLRVAKTENAMVERMVVLWVA